MDIKIGFTESPRELVIGTSEGREDLVARIREAVTTSSGILEFDDAKGRTYLVNAEEIAYVEVGSPEQRSVGFAGM
ncbi:DUF3107 domain-containing protein [Corynebacterium guangdongense]|uniref:DUF3107 domain-containing protein n=1 Tax=Corynebacterium guangdongense TaxID=1783348 RepID=A0ABU1ZUV9_9CORY|nr:DUF3107 domain-containing protein [Corynebacterium guangdongense]MDR7328717.1 hypothetical protein [Corynebacterium guangdongense]WJZ17294.1 hypothetical protein CGUA_03490 [Corynebacterium guangdongense]